MADVSQSVACPRCGAGTFAAWAELGVCPNCSRIDSSGNYIAVPLMTAHADELEVVPDA